MATSPETYRQCAGIQLRAAGEGFFHLTEAEREGNPCAAAVIAGQLWKAVLYSVAVSYQLETGRPVSGKSTQLGGYIERKYGKGDILWGQVNRLHNFELKPEQPRWVFAENCRYTAAFIARLDAALPANLRTPPEALEWLEKA